MNPRPSLLAPCTTATVSRLHEAIWRIVAPNPGPLTGPGTNTYVLGTDRSVVIDPGPEDAAHVERILAATGGTIDRILCTHSHPDHSPAAASLRRLTGARVYGLPPPVDRYQDETYAPDAGLAEGEHIDVAGIALIAIHTPGHASNHVCFLAEDNGLLFTGDHLMSGSTVVIIPPDGSMRQYLESLRALRRRPLQAIAPGHGAVIPDAIGEIDRVVEHRLARETKVLRAVRSRTTATIDELLPDVYDDVPSSLHEFARLSLLAHVIKLEEDGCVTRSGDRYLWRGG